MLRRVIIALASTSAIVSGAQAAFLTDVEGTVLVNKGEGFLVASGRTMVSAGDRVLIRGKGRAQIDYGAGCVRKVSTSQTVVVSSRPTCDSVAVASLKNPPLPLKNATPLKGAIPLKDAALADDGVPGEQVLIVGSLVLAGHAASAIARDSKRHIAWANAAGGAVAGVGGDTKWTGDMVNAVGGAAAGVGGDNKWTGDMADGARSAPASISLNALNKEEHIVIVDNFVVGKSDVAADALNGEDHERGSPVSP